MTGRARQGVGHCASGLGAGGPSFGRTSLRCSDLGPAAETRCAPAALRRSLRSDSRRQVRWLDARCARRPHVLCYSAPAKRPDAQCPTPCRAGNAAGRPGLWSRSCRDASHRSSEPRWRQRFEEPGAPARRPGFQNPRRAAQPARPARAARLQLSDSARLSERSERSEAKGAQRVARRGHAGEQRRAVRPQAGPRVRPVAWPEHRAPDVPPAGAPTGLRTCAPRPAPSIMGN